MSDFRWRVVGVVMACQLLENRTRAQNRAKRLAKQQAAERAAAVKSEQMGSSDLDEAVNNSLTQMTSLLNLSPEAKPDSDYITTSRGPNRSVNQCNLVSTSPRYRSLDHIMGQRYAASSPFAPRTSGAMGTPPLVASILMVGHSVLLSVAAAAGTA
eukprot:7850843-Pyramimonas_sp.AAC.2